MPTPFAALSVLLNERPVLDVRFVIQTFTDDRFGAVEAGFVERPGLAPSVRCAPGQTSQSLSVTAQHLREGRAGGGLETCGGHVERALGRRSGEEPSGNEKRNGQ